jgi:hypothetical protein
MKELFGFRLYILLRISQYRIFVALTKVLDASYVRYIFPFRNILKEHV